jgi:hypothetical protein
VRKGAAQNGGIVLYHFLYQLFVKYSEREDMPECAPDNFGVRQRSRTRECFETQPIQGRSSSVQTGSRARGLPQLSTL